MAVHCQKCGEELMGAVNRCWKCGTEFVSHHGEAAIPPVRRKPLPGINLEAVAAQVLEAKEKDVADDAPQVRWSRRGSPFAEESEGRPEASHVDVDLRMPRRPMYPRRSGANVGAGLAMVLGLISIILAFAFPFGGLAVALVGLTLGLWGIYSSRRSTAILGMLLCCLAFALSGFNGAVELYTYWYGVSPFSTVEIEDPTLAPE